MVMFLALADKEDSRVTEGLNSEGKVFWGDLNKLRNVFEVSSHMWMEHGISW